MKDKITLSPEMAKEETQKWLDARRVKASKIENSKELIETIEMAFLDGFLEFDEETKVLKQKLEFPIQNDKGETTVKSLEYAPRLRQIKITQATEGVSASNFNAILTAYVSAITGQAKAIIGALDTDDFATSRAIATFFM
jgi:hypothetical protein